MNRVCSVASLWPAFGRNEWLIFLTGINLMLLNFIMVQHVTIAFRHPEIAVVLFSLSYFSGISLGYLFSDRFSLRGVQWVLPWFLLTQMLLMVFLQAFSYLALRGVGQLAESGGLPHVMGRWAAYVLVFVAVTVGGTSVYSIFLPSTIEAEDKNVKRFYSIDILGSITGLLLIPVLAGMSHVWLLLGYFVVFLGIAALSGSGSRALLGMSILAAGFLLNFDHWDKTWSGWFYRQWYANQGVRQVAYTRYTPYHKIEVLDLQDDRRMLLLNGKRQFAHASHLTYSYFVAEFPAHLVAARDVCLLGCGSMSTVGRIGDSVRTIDIVDLDPEVFSAAKRFFPEYNRLDELHNWRFVPDDAKHFVANSESRYDLIMHDIPPAYARQIALTYTEEFFRSVKERLTKHGVFSIASLRPLRSKTQYGRKLIATLAHVFDHYFVLQYKRSVYFYGGGPAMRIPEREALAAAVQHPDKKNVRILLQAEIDGLVAGVDIITINNMADLIFDD